MRILLALLALALSAAPAQAQLIDDERAFDDCLEATPHAYAVPDGTTIQLGVLVLLDGVTEQYARAVLAEARSSYDPIGLDLVPIAFAPVKLNATDSADLIEESKALMGGSRPPWVHLVYTITSKDMDGFTAGQADCIGGIQFPDAAFAVGMDQAGDLGDAAKIAAHEVAHLLGAHHHYANCAEGLCTLMFPDLSLVSLKFSSLNAVISRGHAAEWARPLPPPPSEEPQPSGSPPQPQPEAPPAQPGEPPPPQSSPESQSRPATAPTEHERCREAIERYERAQRAESKARRALKRARGRRPIRKARALLSKRKARTRFYERAIGAACRE